MQLALWGKADTVHLADLVRNMKISQDRFVGKDGVGTKGEAIDQNEANGERPSTGGVVSRDRTSDTGVSGPSQLHVSDPDASEKNRLPSLSDGLDIMYPQTLTRLSCDIMALLRSLLLSQQPSQVHNDEGFPTQQSPHDRQSRSTLEFINQSLYYVLSNPELLQSSFMDIVDPGYHNLFEPTVEPITLKIDMAFRGWTEINGSLVPQSLAEALEPLLTSHPDLATARPSRPSALRRASSSGHSSRLQKHKQENEKPKSKYYSDSEALHIVIVSTHALAALVPKEDSWTWQAVRKVRASGRVVPTGQPLLRPMLNIIDALEEMAPRQLVSNLVRVLSTRSGQYECMSHTLDPPPCGSSSPPRPAIALTEVFINYLVELVKQEKFHATLREKTDPLDTIFEADQGWSVPSALLEWTRTAFLYYWDGKASVLRWHTAGGAVELLGALCKRHKVCIMLQG